MKKKRRVFKILSLLLVIAVAFSSVPVTVLANTIHQRAATSGTCGQNLTWSYNGGTLTISGSGEMYSWDYSEGDYSPWYNLDITTVVIKDGVTSVGEYAFMGCDSLEKVTLPDSVRAIGFFAFFDCSNMNSVYLSKNLIAIGGMAFAHCSSLPRFTIPDSVTSIGESVFLGCTNLTEVTLSKNMASTGNDTFDGCSSLQVVNMQDGVKEVGANAFIGCTKLKSITLPESVTVIGDYAFAYCDILGDITIPESVTNISDTAFYNCPVITICGESESYAETYANDNHIPFGKMLFTLNDVWGFKNPSGGMQYKHFRKFFGPALSTIFYGSDFGNGLCFGMVNSAIAISKYNSPPVSSILFNRSYINVLHETTNEDNTDCVLAVDGSEMTGMWIGDYIRYAYTYQKTPAVISEERKNKEQLNSLYNAIKSSLTGNGEPVQISIRGKFGEGDGGHSLLAMGIGTDNHSMTEIYVYDCNKPHELQTLYLYKTTGLYTSWSYSPGYIDWGTGKKYAQISYNTSTDSFVKDIFSDEDDKQALLNYQQLIAVQSNDLNVRTSDGVLHDIDSDDSDFLEIETNNILLEKENYNTCEAYLYWVKESGEMTFESCKESNEITVASQNNMIETTLPANAVLTVNVPDDMDDNYAVIKNMSSNSQYTISYTNCVDEKLYKTSITGETVGTVETEVVDSAIVVKGKGVLEIETALDNTIVETVSVDTKNYSVKITQNKKDKIVVLADTNNDGTFEKQLKTVPVSKNPFTDVSSDAYYYEPVLWAVDEGVTTGYKDNMFAPEMACTRGQVVTFLWRAMGSPEPTSAKHPFTDIQNSAYYYKAVLWAVEEGITTGMTKTQFAPESTVTRGQFVTFLHRAMGNQGYNTKNPFKDVSSSAYYYNPILWAYENKVTSGLTSTKFGPEDSCTRGQVVTFLYRALE